MKLKNYFWLIGIFMFVGLALTLTSCGDDDNDGGGGKVCVSTKLGDKSLKLPYGYWYMEDEYPDHHGGTSNTVQMEFYSFDPTSGKFPSTVSFVSIDFDLPAGQREITSTVIESGKYHIYVVYGASMNSEGIQCETQDGDTGNAPLKIVRNGDSYTVTIEHATVGDEDSDKNKEYSFSFNYSGKLKHEVVE